MDNREAFFALLRAGLWEEVNENEHLNKNLFLGLDWGEVQKLAEEQSVLGLVAAGVEKLPARSLPLAEKLTLLGMCQLIEQRNFAMNRFVAELIQTLHEAGINAVLVKGQGVAQCYYRPLLRETGDIDLLLDGSDYSKAKDLLFPLAGTVEKDTGNHLGMYIGSFLVELHGSLKAGLPSRVNSVLDDIKHDLFQGDVRSWINDNKEVFLPGADGDVVYVFVHFLNHFYKGGVGCKQFCDWCRLLWKYQNTFDLTLLLERLHKMKLLSEWKGFAAFAVEYLGMPVGAMPFYDPKPKWKRKARRIKDFIFNTGNLGHNRDTSYYTKYPYLIRKAFSMKRRMGDLMNHALIFPVGSLRFFFTIIGFGVRSVLRGL